jgi:hypothetical protein
MKFLTMTLLPTAAVLLLTLFRPVLSSPSPNHQGLPGSIARRLDLGLEMGLRSDGGLENQDLEELLSNNDDKARPNGRKKRQDTTTSTTSSAAPSSTATSPAAPGAGDENYIEACPNQNYEGINATITCMNFTDPTMPKGYGGRTCSMLLCGS